MVPMDNPVMIGRPLHWPFRLHKLRFSALTNIDTKHHLLCKNDFKRSHLLGELNESLLQKEVTLCGWVSAVRSVSRNLFFLLLRDHSGIVQLTLTRTHIPEETFLSLQDAVDNKKITPEAVLAVKGTVQPRPIGMSNSSMASGSIEIFVNQFKILNSVSQKLPFTLHEKYLPSEEVRLQDRVLDLRRPEMQDSIRFRAQVNRNFRSFFNSQGFVEIETPILFKSSPEGAKEFLVSRPDGLKYALPQSPQQFKQLLMIGGFDRYFQIARCFRDEGMRSDRQPEFTQLDMEMAFVDQEEVIQVMESAIKNLWKAVKGIEFEGPFPRISYDEAMSLYGSDKPDLRIPSKIAFSIQDDSDCFIEGLLLKGKGRNSLNRDDSYEFCFPIEGLRSKEVIKAFESSEEGSLFKWHGNDLSKCGLVSSGQKFEINVKLNELGLNVGPRDCLLLQKRKLTLNGGMTDLGRARLAALNILIHQNEIEVNPFNFLWVHTFPLLCPASSESLAENPLRKYDSMHHPFTAPICDDFNEVFGASDPLKLRAKHYDLVLNGQEIGGGSVRIHDSIFQERLMRELLGLNDTQINHFSHLLRALKFGAPPHAGMAFGLDRLVAILAGKQSIREVIAFPKNSSGQDLCFNAPN